MSITAPATVGTYNGTLTATPASGNAGAAGFALVEYPAPVVFTAPSQPTQSQNGNVVTGTWTFYSSNPMAVVSTGLSVSTKGGYGTQQVSGTCSTGSSVPANGTCTAVITATTDCVAYNIKAVVSNSAGATTSTYQITVPKNGLTCN